MLDGITAPLTAGRMLTFDDVAATLTDLTGRRVSRVVVSDADWKAAAVSRGMPEGAAEFTLGIFRAARAGEFAVTDPLLEKVLGRAPITARAALAEMLAR
ncbi:hypothetical protein [Pseudonocardia xishanensis]|uniref:NmrA-like family protein n=1 Tax=Pseudonocardia xishanensis TaxID=630995 RepID=A0ABP8RQZ6_9PSEU